MARWGNAFPWLPHGLRSCSERPALAPGCADVARVAADSAASRIDEAPVDLDKASATWAISSSTWETSAKRLAVNHRPRYRASLLLACGWSGEHNNLGPPKPNMKGLSGQSELDICIDLWMMSIAAFRTGEKSRINGFFCFSGSIYTIWIWEWHWGMKTQQVEGRKDKPCRLHTLLATDRWESQVIFLGYGTNRCCCHSPTLHKSWTRLLYPNDYIVIQAILELWILSNMCDAGEEWPPNIS